MEEELQKAIFHGKVNIGGKELKCAVLEDGTRVLSSTAIFQAFDRPRKGKGKEIYRTDMPSFIDANNLKPFIDEVFGYGTDLSIKYINNNRELSGYKAEILPLICEVYLKARENGVLYANQEPVAKAAEILVRSLSKVGIIALIDEATGYQEFREKEELQKLLSIYVAKDLLPWTKTFPDEFYIELFRLRGWDYKGKPKSPYVGKLTNYLVYDRHPPEVVDELKRLNPKNETGHRKHKLFQRLTEDTGYIQLKTLVSADTILMRGFDTWDEFDKVYRKAYNITEPLEDEQLTIKGFKNKE